MSSSKLTQKKADRLRSMRLLNHIFGLEFASLWWVPDVHWKNNLGKFTPRKNNAHPGVIIRQNCAGTPFDPIPLLLGRSQEGPVKVLGISKDEPEHPTHFGGILRPGFFSTNNFLDRKNTINQNKIHKITQKPIMDTSEQSDLITFLNNKGLL